MAYLRPIAFILLPLLAGMVFSDVYEIDFFHKDEDFFQKNSAQAGEYYILTFEEENAYAGTTLFTDHREGEERLVEIDMYGNIVWEYNVPEEIQALADPQKGLAPGFDVEELANGNLLVVYPRVGVYEITRAGEEVWSHLDSGITHDADRLENGNTLYALGADVGRDSVNVKEVNMEGDVIWQWSAGDWYDEAPWNLISRTANVKKDEGNWLHTNAVQRLDDGRTLISPRNFDITILVDETGEPVWTHEWGTASSQTDDDGDGVIEYVGFDPHEPYVTQSGTLLVCLQRASPYQAVEIDMDTHEVLWTYARKGLQTARDCDRLPNGNTLIVGVMQTQEYRDSTMFEVTPEGEIVWEMRIKDTPSENTPGLFFKAQRISYP